MKEITQENLAKAFEVTQAALKEAEQSKNRTSLKNEREDCIDLVRRYIADAKHFEKNGDFINAFGALYYAHGILDALARTGMCDVHNSKLFVVD